MYVEKHQPNKEVDVRAVSYFRQFFFSFQVGSFHDERRDEDNSLFLTIYYVWINTTQFGEYFFDTDRIIVFYINLYEKNCFA